MSSGASSAPPGSSYSGALLRALLSTCTRGGVRPALLEGAERAAGLAVEALEDATGEAWALSTAELQEGRAVLYLKRVTTPP
jgi:hypothetical protein